MDIFRQGIVPNKLALADYLNIKGLVGEAAEIGVWRGDFSVPFLNKWRGKLLHLIDPWAKLPEEEYDDIRNRDFNPNDEIFLRANVERYGNRVNIIKAASLSAERNINRHSLDFAYIDANHTYQYVRADLDIWWSKIKPGGILAGHDIFTIYHPGVTSAVSEFCHDRSLVCNLIPAENDALSFYIEKPS